MCTVFLSIPPKGNLSLRKAKELLRKASRVLLKAGTLLPQTEDRNSTGTTV